MFYIIYIYIHTQLLSVLQVCWLPVSVTSCVCQRRSLIGRFIFSAAGNSVYSLLQCETWHTHTQYTHTCLHLLWSSQSHQRPPLVEQHYNTPPGSWQVRGRLWFVTYNHFVFVFTVIFCIHSDRLDFRAILQKRPLFFLGTTKCLLAFVFFTKMNLFFLNWGHVIVIQLVVDCIKHINVSNFF